MVRKKPREKTRTKEEHTVGFGILTLVALLTLVVGTVFYRFAESWAWLDSLYFSVITLTTVGFGDLAPTTGISKLFTVFYVFIGIGIILGFVNLLAKKEFMD